MPTPVRLISTDFDGTIFAEFENPPVPVQLQELLGGLQSQGVKWVINTGRDMSSLQEALGRARLSIQPDYLVLVEREIYVHAGHRYLGHEAWNLSCTRDHAEIFAKAQPLLPQIVGWINGNFNATIYQDAYSPFCLIARSNLEADRIVQHIENVIRHLPGLVLVRNDVYMRFSREGYNKGAALAEICRLEGIPAAEVFAAGDHLNDLPMLRLAYARHLAAPANAMPEVKDTIAKQGGFISGKTQGHGIAEALERICGNSPFA